MAKLGDIPTHTDPNIVASGTTLPISDLVEGMEFDLIVGGGSDMVDIGAALGPRFWRMKWYGPTQRWHCIGGEAAEVIQATEETVSSTSWQSLGAQIGVDAITIPWTGWYEIELGYRLAPIGQSTMLMGFQNVSFESGTTYMAPNDALACSGWCLSNGSFHPATHGSWSARFRWTLSSEARQAYIQPMFKIVHGGPCRVNSRWMKIKPVWLNKLN